MSHPSLESIAAWVEGLEEPAESQGLDLHLLECGTCSAHAAGLQRLVSSLRQALPPVLTEARHQALRAAHERLPASHVQPGESGVLRLSNTASVGVWVMHCDLVGVTRVDLETRTTSGELLFAVRDVPFDAERGQVLLACQVHYRSLPAQLRTTLSASTPSGVRTLGEYFLDHQFDSA